VVRGRKEEDASLSAINEEGETSGFERKFIGKTTTQEQGKTVIIAASTFLSTGWWEAARARHKGECIEGACWMRVRTVRRQR
jgi:hypothetical protein